MLLLLLLFVLLPVLLSLFMLLLLLLFMLLPVMLVFRVRAVTYSPSLGRSLTLQKLIFLGVSVSVISVRHRK